MRCDICDSYFEHDFCRNIDDGGRFLHPRVNDNTNAAGVTGNSETGILLAFFYCLSCWNAAQNVVYTDPMPAISTTRTKRLSGSRGRWS